MNANVLDSLTRRKSSTSADTTRYDLDSPRHTDLIAALELADEVKTALQNDVDAALGAVFCHPKFPWVIAAPFLDVYDYDGGCILLHCHEVRRSDVYPDSIGGAAVNQTAKDDAWRAVEWMLHVMAAGGRFRDTEASLRVTVYLGLFSEAGQLVLTDEKTWGAGDVFGDAIQLLAQPEIEVSESAVTVPLTWQAGGQPAADHTYFIHLYRAGAEDEPPVAQLDQQQAQERWAQQQTPQQDGPDGPKGPTIGPRIA